MKPRRILDQPIANFPGETWLREMIDMETGDGETHASVYQGTTAARAAPSTAEARGDRRDGRTAALDPLDARELAEAAA